MATAMVNLGADIPEDQTTKKEPQDMVQLSGEKAQSAMAITTIRERTNLEKILVVVAVVLVILCIVFIALLAKEKNDSATSPNPSTGKSKGEDQEKLSATVNCSKSITVNEGERVSCVCNSSDNEPPGKASWSKNGEVIDAEEKMLLLMNISKEDSGAYTCTVQHDKLKDETTVYITIKYKPRVISFKAEKTNGNTVERNSKVTIRCKADAYPAATYTMFHDRKIVTGDVDGVYNINSAKSIDAGKYECQAKNELGKSSSSFVLNVKGDGTYEYSDEAVRVGLQPFLKKIQTSYYELNRHSLPWKPLEVDEDIVQLLHDRHQPYNTTPAHLKKKTDAALALLNEINNLNMDENKMYPREVKAVDQVKHFLQTVFGNPYDENFYNGDWMLGPNHFCWQQMCSIPYNINAYAHYVNANSLKELEIILDKIMANRDLILQFMSNMQLGVRTGMVRSKYNCESGLNAFKQEFKEISKENKPEDVLKEWFVKKHLHRNFLKNLSQADNNAWQTKEGKTPSQSINDTIVEGIGQPIVELINYMANDHIRHCLPRDLASGLGNLPVDYIYWDGNKTNNRTTKTLPITNGVLSGKESYKNILPYFTTSDITPERINEIGNERLQALYPQVVEIAKNVTKIDNETEAIREFQKILLLQKQFYNNDSFPEIESNATAHKRCTDKKSAEKYCPKRWAAMMTWVKTCRQTMAMLSPKLIPLFYHIGKKITIPNCPIEMLPSFNPSSGAQFFNGAGSACTRPAYFGLPFFLENFGPRFSEWSVTAHESWPGHHTQIQAQYEYFKDPYGGVPKWIDDQTYYTFFTEGWGLYSENPVIAKDTDTYDNYPMQKYGMLKWQVWRALRLIVDTGLHYRGMNRTEALGYFAKYAWDKTDLAKKEITRYQGSPGQATAYMLGQQRLVQLRDYATKKLGDKFNVQDFHYQTLCQGSAPETYLAKHIEKYVNCTLGTLGGKTCDVILNPIKRQEGVQAAVEEGPPRPPRPHYI